MYAANVQQLFKKNPQNKTFSAWVLFLRVRADTKIENAIRLKHEDIASELMPQNVSYAEITTRAGKKFLYDKFKCLNKKHPLFMVFNKFPVECEKGDYCMVIEWGKWTQIDKLKEDVMEFACFFSDKDFQKRIQRAHTGSMWKYLMRLLPIIQTAISILRAVL